MNDRALLLRKAVLGAATAAALLTFAQQHASAATGTWTGATDATWGTAGNWIGGVPNATTDDAIFYDATANAGNLNITLGANKAVRSLTFNSNAINPVTLNIGNTSQLTIQGGVTGGDVVVAAGSHKIAGVAAATVQELKLGGSTVWNIQSGASLEVSARMIQGASSNSFTKTGDGALILSADETGGTSQNLSGGGYVVQQGALVFANRKAVGNTATPVTVSGGATIEWRDFNGGYNATGGKFTLQDGAHWLVTSATNATATMSTGANSQLFLTSGSATIDTTTGPLTINDDINGAGGFTKTGTNVLMLGDGGTSTYTGKTVVAAGRLKMNANSTLGNSPSVEVQAGAKFDVSNNASGGLKSFQVLGGAGNVTGAATLTTGTLAPGMVGTAGTLTFDTSLALSGINVALDLSDPSATNDQIAVTGALTIPSATVVNVNRVTGTLNPGTYTIATYGTLGTDAATVTANLQLPQVRQGMTLVDPSTTPGSLQVLVGAGSAASLVWTGSASGTWDRLASNFTNGGSADHFYDWDDVTFDDTSSVNAVDVGSLITPNNVTFNNNSTNYTLSGAGTLNAVKTFTKSGTGTLTVSNNGTNSINSLVVTGGTLVLANPTAPVIGSTTNSATIQVGNGTTAGSLGAGPVANSGTVAFNRSDTVTATNAISGSGNVEMDGAGTLVLTGASTYTGTTTVNSGTLKVNSGSSTGDTNGAAITVKSGATFDIGGNTTANNFNLGAKTVHIAGNGVGGTAGAITNSGTVTQNAAFNNVTLDADAMVTGGRMDIGRTTTVTSRTLDLGGHTLTVAMTGTQPLLGILDGTTVTAGNIVVNGTGSALDLERSLVLDNVGGTITFNTGTVLQTFQTTSGSVKRPMVFNGGNTIGSGNGTVGIIDSNMTLNGDVTLQAVASGVPGTANNPLQLAGNISGTGGITKAGTNSVTLSGSNTYAGATAVNGGTLVLGGSNTGSSSLAVADGAVVQVVNGAASTERFGGLNLNGSGKLDVDGAKLVVGGAMSPATFVSYVQRGYASGAWNGTGLMSTSAQAMADPSRVRAVGWAAAGDVNLTGGSWGAATGLAATDLVAKLTYYGDLNLDGRVNGDDYTLLDKFVAINGVGGTVPARWIDGDVNYDGFVTAADFMLTDTAFGLQGGALSPEFLATRQAQFGDAYVAELVAAVPEPATLGLVAAAGSMLALRRRRKA